MPTQISELTRRGFLTTAGHSVLAAGALSMTAFAARGAPLAPPDKQPDDLKIPGPMEKKLGYAIVGLGELALSEILPAFASAKAAKPVALVSGHDEKAKKVAAHYGINEKAVYTYDNFDSIKDNPEVDIVYVVLPNSLHAEFTERAAKAGKHVLCEKPMSIDINQAKSMIDTCQAASRKLMIAYRLRHDPFHQTLIELVQKQAYGKLKLIETANCQSVKAPNIRLSRQLRGGPLGDVGIYCLNATRYLTSEEPVEFTAMKIQPSDDARFAEVPARYVWTERFPSGVLASCSCSFDTGGGRPLMLFFEKAVVELQNAYGYRGQRLIIHEMEKSHEIEITPVNQFAAEMDHLAACIKDNKTPLTPGEEGLRDELHMTAIDEAADTGRLVKNKL